MDTIIDHRRLGRELGIYTTSELVGAGFPLWLPDGTVVREELAAYLLELEKSGGYQHVVTPVVAKEALYEASGHLRWFADEMFPPMTVGQEQLRLRPVNCPHHILVYQHERRSYRDLPLRFAELGAMFRLERSGVVGGLTRVRMMTLSDAHLFCQPEHLDAEIDAVVDQIERAYRTLGIRGHRYRLSLSSPDGGKWAGERSAWVKAERLLEGVLHRAGVAVERAPGEAAFYGPKIDVQVDDAAGREMTLSTVQVDFWMPNRFDLGYVGADGALHRPVMIHRSLLSTAERLVAFLLEHHRGALPLWLAPRQVAVLPVAGRHERAARGLVDRLRERRIRAEVSDSADSVASRVRAATAVRIPYVAVIGDRECEEGTVTVRVRAGSQRSLPVESFIEGSVRLHAGRSTRLEPLSAGEEPTRQVPQ